MNIIVRYAELGLKGNNRSIFEQQLVRNIHACLRAHKVPLKNIARLPGRILINTQNECKCLREVFGIASFSTAHEARDIEHATTIITSHTKLNANTTFRVSCQRTDKTFPLTSMQVNEQLGAQLVTHTGASVNLTSPDIRIDCEIIKGTLYICTQRTSGPGGLPVGTTGEILTRAEKHDDLYAAFLMLKRGCTITLCKTPELRTDWLEHYSHGHPIIYASLEQFRALAAKAPLAAQPDTLESFNSAQLPCPVIYPLIGLTPHAITAHLESAMRTV